MIEQQIDKSNPMNSDISLHVRRLKSPHSHLALFLGLSLVALGVVVEGASRIVYAHKDGLKGQLHIPMSLLHEYEERDPKYPANWRLKAGFIETFGELKARIRSGQLPPGTHPPAGADRDGNADGIFVRVNREGFRGPEIAPSHSKPRVLTIGDSCTFGTTEESTYPRAIQRKLHELGRDVEVINGGVEGYSPWNVLSRIDQFKRLRPEVTTVYIGWTPLFAGPQVTGVSRSWARLDSLRLAGIGVNLVLQAVEGAHPLDLHANTAPKHPDADAPEVRRLNDFVPGFMPDLEAIAREMQSVGSKVILVTLPGLYTSDGPVSAKALEVGHLPAFTDNPYVLAKMSERYNEALRRLAERQHLQLIDLDGWSRQALTPRDEHFADSVHVNGHGEQLVGDYIATQLLPALTTDFK